MRLRTPCVTHSILFIALFVFLFVLSGHHGHSGTAKKIKNREIQIKKLLVLSDLKPKMKRNFNSGMHRNFDVDEKGNYYILDNQKNGVFVFTPEGKFIRQIGSFGTDETGLFQTNGMRIRNNKLYVNNDSGKQIKVFSLDGKYLHHTQFGKSVIDGTWIDVHGGIYYTVIKAAYERYNELKLFHLYKKDTGHFKQFGRLIQCQNIYGYRIFNACMFSIRNDNIVGAFLFVPVVFRYNLKGEEIYNKDLRKMGLDEIMSRDKQAKERGCDRPEKILSEGRKIMMMQYCNGFDVDQNLHTYYAVVPHDLPPTVYHLDENGEIVERLILKNGKDIVLTQSIFIAEKANIKYGIGFLSAEQTGKSARKVLFSF